MGPGCPAGVRCLCDWVQSDALEDAALGGAAGTTAINARRGGRGISPDDFMRSRRIAEATGVAGEELLNTYFEQERQDGRIEEFEWTASINAISLFDFRVVCTGGELRLVDAKSTTGAFTNPIHLSSGELYKAVHGPEPYDICRLYEVTGEGAKMRIARNIGPALQQTLEIFGTLPPDVTVDGISLRPNVLAFSAEELVLEASSDEDSD